MLSRTTAARSGLLEAIGPVSSGLPPLQFSGSNSAWIAGIADVSPSVPKARSAALSEKVDL